jgi:NAD(P)H-dependent flavin oxidoreductase YrpB (nitropropane dioxygenase family)
MAFLANGFKMMRSATEEGDLEQGALPVGQVQGLIHDEPTVAEVIERMVTEARQVQSKVAGIMN